MNLRCRGPDGQTTLSGLDTAMTVAAFQAELASRLQVQPDSQELLAGFPPKIVQLPQNPAEAALSTLGLANGDTVVVRRVAPATAQQPVGRSNGSPYTGGVPQGQHNNEPQASQTGDALQATERISNAQQAQQLSEDEQLAQAIAASLQEQSIQPEASDAHAAAPTQGQRPAYQASDTPQGSSGNQHIAAPSSRQAVPQQSTPAVATCSEAASAASTSGSTSLHDGSVIVWRKVDDDNSCLFSAVGYVMEGSRAAAARLRRVVAQAVADDPFTYNEGFLGKANEGYQKWIVDPKRWGGAIELSIFARHFGREIAAYDIETRRCDVYGQGDGFPDRAMLIYDGLHYDALAVSAFDGAPEELDVTIIEQSSSQASAIDQAAAALTAQAHQARQFTDTARFTLRCGTCKIGVQGEKEAVEHAQKTGHANFTEYH